MKPRPLSLLAVLLLLPCARADEPKRPAYPPPAEVREAFRKLLDRPAVAPDVKVHDTKAEGDLVVERLSFASEKKADGGAERVPVLLVRPAKAGKKLPAVIV